MFYNKLKKLGKSFFNCGSDKWSRFKKFRRKKQSNTNIGKSITGNNANRKNRNGTEQENNNTSGYERNDENRCNKLWERC